MPKSFKKIWRASLLSSPVFLLAYVITITLWKPYFLLKILVGQKIYKGKLNSTQRKEILKLVLIDQIHPRYYFLFNFNQIDAYEKRHHYLYHRSLVHCFQIISRNKSIQYLNDKYQFGQFCQNKNIPIPKLFALVKKTDIQKKTKENYSELDSFIIKPVTGSKGKGFDRYSFDKLKINYYSTQEKNYISKKNLDAHLKKLAAQYGNLLIQEELVNHIKVAKLSNDALATLRILSIRKDHKEIELFNPILQCPQGDAILNDLASGGVFYSIDLDTGRLIQAINQTSSKDEYEKFVLPFWSELKAYVIQLHAALDDVSLVGWDIAITSEGPKFLEGNLAPWLDIHQLFPNKPFLENSFSQIFMKNLEDSMK